MGVMPGQGLPGLYLPYLHGCLFLCVCVCWWLDTATRWSCFPSPLRQYDRVLPRGLGYTSVRAAWVLQRCGK